MSQVLNIIFYENYCPLSYNNKKKASVVTFNNFVQEKAMEATKQKEEKRGKPKPEEQEGMPQRHHCPLEKRRGDSVVTFHLTTC
jgi:hypothetical protein